MLPVVKSLLAEPDSAQKPLGPATAGICMEALMAEGVASIQRPQRWDVPFGEKMTDGDVAWLLARDPFRRMDPARFPASTPLEGVLRNDCRIVRHQPGDLIIREG